MSTSSSRSCMFSTRPVTAAVDLLEAQAPAADEPTVQPCSAPRDSYMKCAQDKFVDDPCRRRRGRWMGMGGRSWREASRTPAASPERPELTTPSRAARTPSPVAAPSVGPSDKGTPSNSLGPAQGSPLPRDQTGPTGPFGSSPVPKGWGFGKNGGLVAKFDGPYGSSDDGASRAVRAWRQEQDKRPVGEKAGEARGPSLGLATGATRTGTASPLPFLY